MHSFLKLGQRGALGSRFFDQGGSNTRSLSTKEVRSPESRAYALLNDSEHSLSFAVEGALRSYEVRPVPWSRREEMLEELAA